METDAARLGRLRLRSIRRGTREMDLILDDFSARRLGQMTSDELTAYEALLAEDDHDLYRWITGQEAAPATHAPLIAEIAEGATGLAAEY